MTAFPPAFVVGQRCAAVARLARAEVRNWSERFSNGPTHWKPLTASKSGPGLKTRRNTTLVVPSTEELPPPTVQVRECCQPWSAAITLRFAVVASVLRYKEVESSAATKNTYSADSVGVIKPLIREP